MQALKRIAPRAILAEQRRKYTAAPLGSKKWARAAYALKKEGIEIMDLVDEVKRFTIDEVRKQL